MLLVSVDNLKQDRVGERLRRGAARAGARDKNLVGFFVYNMATNRGYAVD